jgi:Fe-S cluster assembly iron-binding protein IscA
MDLRDIDPTVRTRSITASGSVVCSHLSICQDGFDMSLRGVYPKVSSEGRHTVLTVTPNAAEAIHDLVAKYPGTGLRIWPRFRDGDRVRFGLELSDRPAPTDQVIEEHGSQVFLDEQVAPVLDAGILDVCLINDHVAFKLFR